MTNGGGETLAYRDGVEVDENQAGWHNQVGHQGQRSQVFQVGGEHQQDDGGQEAEHVEAGVEARHHDLRLVGVVHVAVEGGGVGCFHHLVKRQEERTHTLFNIRGSFNGF